MKMSVSRCLFLWLAVLTILTSAQELDWNTQEDPTAALAERDLATAFGSGIDSVSEGENKVPPSDLLKLFIISKDRELAIFNEDYDLFYLSRKGDTVHFVSETARGTIAEDNIPGFLAIVLSVLASHYDRGLHMTADGSTYHIEPAASRVSNPFSLTGSSIEYSHHPLTSRLMLFLASSSDGRFLLLDEPYEETARILEFVRKDGKLSVTFPDNETSELPDLVSATAIIFTVQALTNFSGSEYSVFVNSEKGTIADAISFFDGKNSGRFLTVANLDGTATMMEIVGREGAKPRARFSDDSGREMFVFDDATLLLAMQAGTRLLQTLNRAQKLVLSEGPSGSGSVVFDSQTADDKIFLVDFAAFLRRRASGSLLVVDEDGSTRNWSFDEGRISLESDSGLVSMPSVVQMALVNGIELVIPNLKTEQKLSRASSCEQNLRDIGTAMKLYYVNNGEQWPRELSLLQPIYLKSLPECPEAGKDTYTRGYRISGAEATIRCKGAFHENVDLPLWSSRHGVLAEEAETAEVHITVEADSILSPAWSLKGEWLALDTFNERGFAVSPDGALLTFDANGRKLADITKLDTSETITHLRVADHGDGYQSLIGYRGWGDKLSVFSTDGFEEFVHDTPAAINDVLCFDMYFAGEDQILVGYNGAGGIELLTLTGELVANFGGANVWDLEPGAKIEAEECMHLLGTYAKGDIMKIGAEGAEFVETPVYSKYVLRMKDGGYLTAGRNNNNHYLLRITEQGSVVWEAPFNGGSIDDLRLSPDQKWVSLSMSEGPTYLLSTESGKVRARTKSSEQWSRCAWLGSLLVVANGQSVSGYTVPQF